MAQRGWQRSRQEILTDFQNQMKAIAVSCASFDSGNTWEAARLANAVFILVHDSGSKTRSILTQLGVRGSLRFASTGAPYKPGNLVRSEPLVSLMISGAGARYVPALGGALPPRFVQFHTWWNDEIIFADPGTSLFLNRRRLTWALRNQDGGAHLDETVTDPAYVRVSREQKNSLFVKIGDNTTQMGGSHLATMRQIAWEIQQTVADVK